jgi:Methyltransferase domain
MIHDITTTKDDATKEVRHCLGTIVGRRSLGRFLAFADIRLDNSCDDVSETVVPVVFRRQLVKTEDFPLKKAALPFAARVELTCLVQGDGDGAAENTEPWEVTHWKLLTNPHEQAIAAATNPATFAGISCTDYLRSRREAFDAATQQQQQQQSHQGPKQKKSKPPVTAEDTDDDAHGSHKTKALRAKLFAAWIIDTLLRNDGSDRVLDVAGGKGYLSMELAAACAENIHCTVMDPLQRKRPTAAKKQLVKHGKPVPEFVTSYFVNHYPTTTMMDRASDDCPQNNTDALIQSHTCLVGLHPDQCTEDILDVALQCNKSVAIVPCCVFPTLFPVRTLRDGNTKTPVRTYQDFLLYLLQKDPRLRQTTLPFEGKNECIYLKVDD